jgi:hypothetical protein
MIVMAQFFSTFFMDVYSVQQEVSIAKGRYKSEYSVVRV